MDVFAKDYALISDSEKVQTTVLQQMIDDCHSSGGGTVYLKPGIYRTGTLYIRSDIYLHLPPMCTLKGSDDLADYNASDAWEQNMIVPSERIYGQHLIVILESDNCGIVGGGTIDGNGSHFGYDWNDPDFVRPAQMVYICESKDVRIENVYLINSTYWSCFVHGCENVILTGLRVRNNANIPNGDGIDIDASRRVVVSNCIIQTQDDCITFRCDNGVFSHLKDKTAILEDVVVTNCHLHTEGCNAFRIGVGNGAIRNCQVSNIVIRNSAKGICMESRYLFNSDEQPGVKIENLSFQNVFMECKMPLFLSSHCSGISDCYAPPIRNIRFCGLTVEAQHGIVVQGNENGLVENITFRDVTMSMKGIPECKDANTYGEWDYVSAPAPFYIANADAVTLDGVRATIEEDESPLEYAIIAKNAEVDNRNLVVKKCGKILSAEKRGTKHG